jgi:hypothetical protein
VRAANPDIGPEADLRAEAERQRRAAAKALARAHKAGVIEVPEDSEVPDDAEVPDDSEVPERTDTPMPGVRTISARDGDEEEEEPDHTRSEPAPTAAGPPMRPSS